MGWWRSQCYQALQLEVCPTCSTFEALQLFSNIAVNTGKLGTM